MECLFQPRNRGRCQEGARRGLAGRGRGRWEAGDERGQAASGTGEPRRGGARNERLGSKGTIVSERGEQVERGKDRDGGGEASTPPAKVRESAKTPGRKGAAAVREKKNGIEGGGQCYTEAGSKVGRRTFGPSFWSNHSNTHPPPSAMFQFVPI